MHTGPVEGDYNDGWKPTKVEAPSFKCIREVFTSSFKTGQDLNLLAEDASIALSQWLQRGAEIADVAKSLGEPHRSSERSLKLARPFKLSWKRRRPLYSTASRRRRVSSLSEEPNQPRARSSSRSAQSGHRCGSSPAMPRH